LLNAVAEEWHNILHDETTNILNFQEVLESRGVFTKIDTERKQIYFSNKEITDTSKKVIGLYKIASSFNYQFGAENNVFDYDKSMAMLLKGTMEDEEIKSIEKKFNFKTPKKKNPELELELSNEKQSLEKQIQGYKESIKEIIENELKGYEYIPESVNVLPSDRKAIQEYNSMLKSVKTRATAEFLKDTFKESTKSISTEKLMESRMVKENESTDFFLDKFFTLPYQIDKLESPRQVKRAKKNIEKEVEKIVENIKEYIHETEEYKKATEFKKNNKYHFDTTDSILRYRQEQAEIEELKAKGLYKEPKIYYSNDEVTPKSKVITKSVEKKQEIRNYDIEYKEPDSSKNKKKEREY
jgi:chromosome segregation protein SMC